MRTRTELGQLHLSEAIRRQRDCLQVIGKTAGRLAPRARFELATLRLTAEMLKNLNALSGVAYEELGAIFPYLVAPTPAPTRQIQLITGTILRGEFPPYSRVKTSIPLRRRPCRLQPHLP